MNLQVIVEAMSASSRVDWIRWLDNEVEPLTSSVVWGVDRAPLSPSLQLEKKFAWRGLQMSNPLCILA